MIDKYAGQLSADGLMQQRGEHGGIDASRQSQQHAVLAHLSADARNAVLDDIASRPARAAAGDFAHEAPQNFAALQTMRDFRMKLQAVKMPRFIRHGGERRIVAGGDDLESRRQRRHAIAMTHPHIQQAPALRVAIVLEAIEQRRGIRRPDLRRAEFPVRGSFDLTAELRGHGLHAIANSQHRHAQRIHFARRFESLGVVNRFRSARQYDGFGCEGLDLADRRIAGIDLGVHADFADAAGDQLRVLSTKIENQNPVRMNVGHQPIR